MNFFRSPILWLAAILLVGGIALEMAWAEVGGAGLLYLAAVAATAFRQPAERPRDLTYWVAAAASLATITTAASTGGIALAALVVGRLITIAALWAAAVMITWWRRAQLGWEESLSESQQQIEQTSEELAETESVLVEFQQALRDADASYMSLVDHLPVHVVRKDLEGRIAFANRTLCELLNRAVEDVLGRTDFDFFPELLAEKYRQDDFNVISNREVFKDVEQYQGPDGTQRFMQVMKSPVIGGDGEVIGVQGIFWDVSENKRQEVELRESEVRKRALFEASMDAIILSDHEAKIVEFNRAAEKMFGYSRKEVVGSDLVDLILPTTAKDRHRDNLLRYAGAGEVGSLLAKRLEVPVRCKDGETFLAEMATQPIPLQGHAAFAIFIRDITDRKQAEAAMRQAKEAAETANSAKSQFVANMSHEIRTPLNAILGMTDLLLGSDLNGEQREYLQLLQESGESLLSVINDILDFSKMEAGKLDLDNAPFDVRERLGDALKSLAYRAHSKGLELVCDVAGDVPVTLIGDAQRLRQIMINLVGNAIKFTDSGEICVGVKVRASKRRAILIEFSVSDTGIGITPEKQRRVFEAFEQADNSMKRRFGGTGLGLAISLRLVELMKGRIGVSSELGKGSRFHFTCRFGLPEVQRALPLPPAEMDNLRVLVVDDNASSRRVLGKMLANWRFRPAVAASGSEALRLVKEAEVEGDRFGLVIADARMPDMDGLHLISQIRDRAESPCPAILMLAASEPGDLRQCERQALAEHLIKPVKQSELFDTIAALLDVRSAVHVAPPAPDALRLRPLKILLAEDTLVNQKLAVGLLERQGHRVTVAGNGVEALRSLESQPFDLVLMDVQMPDMDGLEATETIRRRESGTSQHVPIIAMTAHAMKGDRERCLESGMDGYLAKPIRAAALFETMADLLGGTHRAQSNGDGSSSASVADWPFALQAVQHDQDLLRIIVEAFLEEYPQLLDRVRQAIVQQAAANLSAAAHALKGSMRNFGDTPAYRETYRLETLGREGSVKGAQRVLAAVESGLDRLVPELQQFLETGKIPEEAPAT